MDELDKFVREALASGKSREDIRGALAQSGWRDDEISGALGRFSEVPFGIPVPQRRPYANPREAFLCLVTFSALYTAAMGLGVLLFGLVDHYLPDPVQEPYEYSGSSDTLRWSLAALIVALPIYLILTRKHYQELANSPERASSAVRKWLTYITLTVVALILMGTAVDLVANVFGGALALRFFLKIATVTVIAGSILLFYLWELRSKEAEAK